MNHTQQAANAKIIAELFPTPSEISEAAPVELSQQQLQTLLHIAMATITRFFGPPNRFLVGMDDPRDPSKIAVWLGPRFVSILSSSRVRRECLVVDPFHKMMTFTPSLHRGGFWCASLSLGDLVG